MTRRIRPVAVVVLLSIGAVAAPQERVGGGRCDRACLAALVDSYVAALVAHEPGRVPIAPGAKFVENLMRLKPGDGLWKTASAPPATFKIFVPDPTSGQVGFMGVMQEDGKPIEVAIRLKSPAGSDQ